MRPASIEDAEFLTELTLRSKAHWGYDQTTMAAFRDELTVTANHIVDPRLVFRIGSSGHQILGYYALETLGPQCCELYALFIDPVYIGKGIGRELLSHALDFARTKQAQTLLVQSDPHAASFYKAAGGVCTGTSESLSIPGRQLPTFEYGLLASK